MSVVLGSTGGNKDVTSITLGSTGGNKTVLEGYVGTTGGNKLFFSALSASASPTSVSGSGNTNAITSTASTATPTGGIGPFTYAWSNVGGDAAVVAVSPSSASSTFRKNPMMPGDSTSATFNCLVTDTGTGFSVTTNNVSVSLDRLP